MNPYGAIELPIAVLAALLLLFHWWYDYHVQGSFISSGKRTSNWLLTVHATTWTLFVSIPLYAVGTLTTEQFAFLLASHWAMDWWKCHRMGTDMRAQIIDQWVHIATLGAVLWQW